MSSEDQGVSEAKGQQAVAPGEQRGGRAAGEGALDGFHGGIEQAGSVAHVGAIVVPGVEGVAGVGGRAGVIGGEGAEEVEAEVGEGESREGDSFGIFLVKIDDAFLEVFELFVAVMEIPASAYLTFIH